LKYRKLRIDGPNGKSFARDRKGATSCLFLEDVIQEDPDLSCPLVICEGEIDALSLVASGVPNVVSVPDGAQLDEIGKGQIVPEEDRAFGWLWDGDRLKSHLKQFERIVLATDADRKGRILRDELAVRFEAWRCHAVTYPKGCKDANEVLVKHGPAKLLEIVETAVPLVPDRLVRFGDIPERGPIERLSSGFEGLDDYLKLSFVLPEFVVITGEPGSGKSEFSAILGANLANYHGLPGAILQFEDRSVRVRETLIRYALGNLADISDRASARAWVDQWFRTIEPEQNLEDGHDYTLEWLEESIREARVRHGCRWVILDPWNEIEHVWERGRSETQYINDALRRLKRIARAHQIILMVVAHPSKEGARIKDIADLDLYSISGSAAWANKADHGIILHRPNKASEEVHIKVAKSKDHAVMGLPGTVTMRYVPMKARYAFVRMGI
jgi:twinkle protein